MYLCLEQVPIPYHLHSSFSFIELHPLCSLLIPLPYSYLLRPPLAPPLIVYRILYTVYCISLSICCVFTVYYTIYSDNAAVSMKSAEKVKAAGGLKKISVPGITIDAFVREYNITKIALLKIDTQGNLSLLSWLLLLLSSSHHHHHCHLHHHHELSLIYSYPPLLSASILSLHSLSTTSLRYLSLLTYPISL